MASDLVKMAARKKEEEARGEAGRGEEQRQQQQPNTIGELEKRKRASTILVSRPEGVGRREEEKRRGRQRGRFYTFRRNSGNNALATNW